MKIPFIGGAYEGISKNANAQTCINLYVEPDPTDPEGEILVGTPGYEQFEVVTSGSISYFYENDQNVIADPADITSVDANNANVMYVNHGYITGQVVTVAQTTNGDYDVSNTSIIVVDKDNFRYTNTGGPYADNLDATAYFITGDGSGSHPYLAEVRGFHQISVNRMVVVVGNHIFLHIKAGVSFTTTSLDTWDRLTSLTGPVSIDAIGIGGSEVIIADGVAAQEEGVADVALFFNGSTTSVLTNQSNTVTEMDGYLIRDDVDSRGTFIYSDLYDASVENSFNYASADGSPDDLLAVVASRRQLFLFGEETTEVWYNSGAANNPFERYQGGFSHVGIAAPMTAQKFAGTVAWLGHNNRGGRIVYIMGDNFSPVPISTPQVAYQISSYSYVWDAFAYSMNWEGHEWYVLTFPTADVTWVFDATSKNWHKWQSGASGRHVTQCHVFAYDTISSGAASGAGVWGNRHFAGINSQNGELYEIKSSLYEDDNELIYRERTSAHLGMNEERSSISSLQLDIEEGQATRTARAAATTLDGAEAAGQTTFSVTNTISLVVGDVAEITLDDGGTYIGVVTSFVTDDTVTCANQPLPSAAASGNAIRYFTNYVASMEWSKDAGQNFGDRINHSLGVSGEDDLRLMWYKLGRGRNWVFRMKTEARSKIRIKRLLAKFYGEPA